MTNKIGNKRYNKLLSYRNNYYAPGGLLGNFGNQFKEGFQEGKLNAPITAIGDIAGNMIGGGKQTGAGNLISSASNIASAIPGPWGAVAGAGLQVLGGITNAAFGTKWNKENIAKTENTINNLRGLRADANSADTLTNMVNNLTLGDATFSDSYIGKDGWFSNKAAKKARKLRAEMRDANDYAIDTLELNADNISTGILDSLESNYAALGGFINKYSDGGGIHINPANRGKFNATKKRTGKTTEELTHSKNPLTRKRAIFSQNASHWKHAFGGHLNTNGSDFMTGLTYIDNGDTHENNPYEGVPMGADSEGTPNLVEQGEVIFNDYVYSNRLTVPKTIRNKYRLKGTKDLTFADAVKQLTKGITERPNDPISQETLHEIMSNLAQSQEEVRETQNVGNQYSHGGTLGNLYDGEGPGWQVLNRNNRTSGLNFGDANFNPYDSNGNIDWNIMYGKESPYMKRRQYVLDNWGSEGVKNWLSKYVEGINAYNKDREGYTPMTIDDITRDVFEKRTSDKSWGGMHSGIDYAGDPSIERVNRYFLRGKDAQGNFTVTPMEVTPWKDRNNLGRTFAETYPQYIEVGKQERPIENGTIYTDYYYDENKPVKSTTTEDTEPPLYLGRSNEALRYAPAIGLGAAVISDALGITNNPEYENAARIEAASRADYKPVGFERLGNYLKYRPFDTDYLLNRMDADAAASRRAIANQSAGNTGAAIAGILASDYNTIGRLGEAKIAADKENFARRAQVEEFNRATNQYNSQGALQADIANQGAYANALSRRLTGLTTAAQMRQGIKDAAEANRAANISEFLSALGDIGYENKSMNIIRRLAEANAFGGLSAGHPLVEEIATSGSRRKNKRRR